MSTNCYKIWVDDVRPMPRDYNYWARSVYDSILMIEDYIDEKKEILIDLDHDSETYHYDGGDYVNILKWMELRKHFDGIDYSNVTFKIHSMNPVGCYSMEQIIKGNGWKLI